MTIRPGIKIHKAGAFYWLTTDTDQYSAFRGYPTHYQINQFYINQIKGL